MAIIRGANSYDVLIGTLGADVIYGYGGDDVLSGGKGADTLNGGAGIDTVDYSREFGARNIGGGFPGSITYTGVDVDLAAGTGKIVDVSGHFTMTTVDTLISIENVIGTRYNDTIRGDSGANAVYAHDGNDFIDGRAGNDSLYGEGGNDTILGGTGSDLINGGAGVDTVSYYGEYGWYDRNGTQARTGADVDLAAGTGKIVNVWNGGGSTWIDRLASIENVQGTDYNDTIKGDGGANVLDGGLGNDILDGRTGNDYLFGNAGNDTLFGGAGVDTIVGGAGVDTVSYYGEYGINAIGAYTGVYVDLNGSSGSITKVVGNVSTTTTDILSQVENVQGTSFGDMLLGDHLANVFDGGLGNDELDGRAGNDYLFGNAGNDTLYGSSGHDTLIGGDGNDLLYGGFGFDELQGGAGADRFAELLGAEGVDRILDYSRSQGDVIDLLGAPGSYTAVQEGAHVMIYDSSRVAVMQLWDYNLANGVAIV